MKVKGRLFNTCDSSLVKWPADTLASLIGKPLRMQGGMGEEVGTVTSVWIDEDGWVCFEAEGSGFPEFLSSTEFRSDGGQDD